MKHLLLLFAFLVLVGCDSQTSQLDDASAVVYIDGKPFEASASVSTRMLDGTAYQVVSLEMADQRRIEILGLAFEEGEFVKQHEANTSFPFVVSYLEADEKPRTYVAHRGSLEIGVARATVLEGNFEFETTDVLSSCLGCEEAKGPTVRGRFRAVRMER
jgi:hypothetical protein